MADAENGKRKTIGAVEGQIDRLVNAMDGSRGGETGTDRDARLVGGEIERLRTEMRSVQREIVYGFKVMARSVAVLKAAMEENRRHERLDGPIREHDALVDELDRLKEAAEKSSRDRKEFLRQLAVLEVERFVLEDLIRSVEDV